MGKNLVFPWLFQKIRLNLSYQTTQTMKKDSVKIASTVYPSDPMPFNEWMKMVYKNAELNAKGESRTPAKQPANFNEWVIMIHNSRN